MRNKITGDKICDLSEKDLKTLRQVYWFFIALVINYAGLTVWVTWNTPVPIVKRLSGLFLMIVGPLAILYYMFNTGSREYYLDEEGFTVRHILLFHQRVSWTQIKGMRSVYFVIDKRKPPQHWIVWSTRSFPSSKRFSNYWVTHRHFSCFVVDYTDHNYELLNRYYGVDKTQES